MKHTINGTTYTTTQEAYLAGTHEHPHYEAHATAEDGTEVMLRWEIQEGYDPEEQDESDACDWDNPSIQ